MKKEILVAILIGLLAGFVVTFGVYRSRQSDPSDTPSILTSPNPSGDPAVNANLALHSPNDEIIVEDASITIAGTTSPNIFVVIFVNDDETITTADETGNFSIETDLEEGSNVIMVYAVDENGMTSKVERTVIFATEDLLTSPNDETSSSTETTSEES